MDASTYDEICDNCGATDEVPGGWGRLALPCPNAPIKPLDIDIEPNTETRALFHSMTRDDLRLAFQAYSLDAERPGLPPQAVAFVRGRLALIQECLNLFELGPQ